MSAARGIETLSRHPAVQSIFRMTAVEPSCGVTVLVYVKRAGGLWMTWLRPAMRLSEDAIEWWKAHDRTGLPGVVVDSIESAEAAVYAFAAGKPLDAWHWRKFAPRGAPTANDGRTT